MVARNARYAAFGNRSCCALSLNTRLPNASAALAVVSEEVRPSFIDQSRMLLTASESAADPIVTACLSSVRRFVGMKVLRRGWWRGSSDYARTHEHFAIFGGLSRIC